MRESASAPAKKMTVAMATSKGVKGSSSMQANNGRN
jgi:hypothetical protein